MSFNLIRGGGGPYLSDAAKLPRWSGAYARFVRNHPVAMSVNSGSINFFTGGVVSIDRIPGSAEIHPSWTVWNGATYNTIKSISNGSGVLSHIISPGLSGAGTVTYRVTIDGVVTSFTSYVEAVSFRSVVGFLLPADAYNSPDNYVAQLGATPTDPFTAKVSADVMVLGPNDPRNPFLVYFARSILIEASLSVSADSGGAGGEYAGAIIQRFT